MSISNHAVDWRSQLAAAESQYVDIFPDLNLDKDNKITNSGSNNLNDTDMLTTAGSIQSTLSISGAYRFPPLAIKDLPRKLSIETMKPYFLSSIDDGVDITFWAKIEQNIVDTSILIIENRDFALTQAENLLGSSSNNGVGTDSKRNKGTLVFLGKLKEEAIDYSLVIANIMKKSVNIEIPLGDAAIASHQRLLQSVSHRIDMLKVELAYSIDLLQSLIMIVETNDGRSLSGSKIDHIIPDWQVNVSLQHQNNSSGSSYSNRMCKRFVSFFETCKIPMIESIYQLIASPADVGYTLYICDHDFVQYEVYILIEYFTKVATSAINDSVHSIVIHNSSLSDDELIKLLTHISIFPNLHTLSFKYNSITSYGIIALSKAMRSDYLFKLKHLYLDNNRIDHEGMRALARSICCCVFLQVLSLAGNPVGDVGLYYLLKHCLNRYRVSRRTLMHVSQVTGSGAATSINHNTEYLSDNDDSTMCNSDHGDNDDTFMYANDGVYSDDESDDSTIDTNNSEVDESDDDIDAAATNNEGDTCIDAGVGVGVGVEVKANPVRRTSILSMKVRNIALFTGGVSNNKRINYKSVFVHKMLLIRAKLLAISAFIRISSRGLKLLVLDFDGCGLTAIACKVIAHVANDNPYIVSIDVSNNFINDDGCRYLSQVVCHSSSIETLKLNNCNITDVGMQLLATACTKSMSLKCIEVCRNKIGPTGITWSSVAAKVFMYDKFEIVDEYVHACPLPKKSDSRAAYDTYGDTGGDVGTYTDSDDAGDDAATAVGDEDNDESSDDDDD